MQMNFKLPENSIILNESKAKFAPQVTTKRGKKKHLFEGQVFGIFLNE